MGAFSKLGNSIRAQFNKMANWFWTKDPIAQMQLEYDRAVDQMKDGRQGLEQYRALVEKVQRQVVLNKKAIAQVEAKIRAYLKVGDRATAGQLAIQLQKHQSELAENEELDMRREMLGEALKTLNDREKRIFTARRLSDDPTELIAPNSFQVLIPAFVISELTTAFQMGVMVLLPFLVVDIAVASLLMSMGMMMVPPTTLSLPMKLLLFVLVDGWNLIAGSLLRSFA